VLVPTVSIGDTRLGSVHQVHFQVEKVFRVGMTPPGAASTW
jgi:hypothetical protein